MLASGSVPRLIPNFERGGPIMTSDEVLDLTTAGPHVERELALIKVTGTGEKRVEALRLADVFRAKVVDTTLTSFIFEITGTSDKVDRFIALMRECGLVEVGRTGVVAIARGAEAV